MSGPTDFAEKYIADLILSTPAGSTWGTGVAGASTTAPTFYVGLFLTMPADDGTGGVEVTGGSYARKQINATDQWQAADSTTAPTVKKGPSGSNIWNFPAPSADWGDTKGWGIWDALSGGNLWFTGEHTGAITVPIKNLDPAPQYDNAHQIQTQWGDPGDPFT